MNFLNLIYRTLKVLILQSIIVPQNTKCIKQVNFDFKNILLKEINYKILRRKKKTNSIFKLITKY